MAGKDHQKWWISMLQTRIVSQWKLSTVIHLLPTQFIQKEYSTLPDYHLSFSCVSDLRNPFLSIFTLLEPYDASSPPYIEFKWNLHWWEAKHLTIWRKKISLINYGTKRAHSQKHQHFFSIKKNISGFLKNRLHPDWSVRTLGQYM